MDSTTFHGTTRRPAFIEGDDGLASLADMEAGFSGDHYRLLSRSSYYNPSSNWRNSSSIVSSSPKSARFYVANCEDNHNPYFLEACFLCKKPLGDNRDIFMYRGDTPFCSEECRQEQIEIDEAKEKNWNLSSSMKAIRNDQKKSTSTNKNENYPVRTDAVAAA